MSLCIFALMSELKKGFINRFGEHRVLDAPVGDGECSLLILDLELKSPVTVIVTDGLSEYKMPVHQKYKGREFNELYFCLPSYWEWEDTMNPRMNWTFHWIQRLVKHVVEKETWYGHGHTIPCGADATRISETMHQNHFILSDPILLQKEMEPMRSGDKTINFLAIIPVFQKELEYKIARGTLKLFTRLANNRVSEKLDDFRGSVMKSKWRLKR